MDKISFYLKKQKNQICNNRKKHLLDSVLIFIIAALHMEEVFTEKSKLINVQKIISEIINLIFNIL